MDHPTGSRFNSGMAHAAQVLSEERAASVGLHQCEPPDSKVGSEPIQTSSGFDDRQCSVPILRSSSPPCEGSEKVDSKESTDRRGDGQDKQAKAPRIRGENENMTALCDRTTLGELLVVAKGKARRMGGALTAAARAQRNTDLLQKLLEEGHEPHEAARCIGSILYEAMAAASHLNLDVVGCLNLASLLAEEKS